MIDTAKRYNQYWRERQGASGEKRRLRSLQRAGIVFKMLSHRKGKLLEVGCGPGYVSSYFSEKGFSVLGVDVSQEAVDLAIKKGLNVRCMDFEMEELPGVTSDVVSAGKSSDVVPAGESSDVVLAEESSDVVLAEESFDVVLALEVLEHLFDPQKMIRKMFSILNPGGELIISLPNEFHLVNRLAILLGFEPFGGFDDPHIHHFGPKSIKRFIASSCRKETINSPEAVIDSFRAVSVVPPAWKTLHVMSIPFARFFPSLFAISIIVSIRRKSESFYTHKEEE